MDNSPVPVFHHAPKPVSVNEFRDAVKSICRPLFPMVRHVRPRKLILAISGGVDSMALAYLTGALAQQYQAFTVADNPVNNGSIFGIVVDHKLRQGSEEEAHAVCRELKKTGIRGLVRGVRWHQEQRNGIDPSQLPNIESLARTRRYQVIGSEAYRSGATSLFFAHHGDDQYETVLMRLLGGHGYRGLQGMRHANDIPECYDLHGVYKSGLLDDQLSVRPYLNFKPSNTVMKKIRRQFRIDTEDAWTQIKSFLDGTDMESYFPGHIDRVANLNTPYLTPLNSEDGGITVYRPLLEFDKDRLRATCEANGVKWFEDATNTDATLTMRNAVRQMIKEHELPRALQKPAILALSTRSQRRVKLEDAEAHRMLVREAVVKDFDPNVGTLLIDLPTLSPRKSRRNRLFDDARWEVRRPRQRLLAAIAIRKLIDFVTPDAHLPPLANLNNTVDKLFPELASEPDDSPPKAFGIAGVLFDPVQGPTSIQWFLSRAPYTSTQELPRRSTLVHKDWRHSFYHVKDPGAKSGQAPKSFVFSLWDGRFWVRLSTRMPTVLGGHSPEGLSIRPLLAEHLRPFKFALRPIQRRRLEALLKYYAPGKVRYTLPALYTEEDRIPGVTYDAPPKLTLLALPTLRIQVPGLERWVKYDARYKKIDVTLLGKRRRDAQRVFPGYAPTLSASRRKRRERVRRNKGSGMRRCL